MRVGLRELVPVQPGLLLSMLPPLLCWGHQLPLVQQLQEFLPVLLNADAAGPCQH